MNCFFLILNSRILNIEVLGLPSFRYAQGLHPDGLAISAKAGWQAQQFFCSDLRCRLNQKLQHK